MSNGATAETGPELSPDQEADHRRQLVDAEIDQAEAAVKAIEAKIEGMKASLRAAKDEVKRLRSAKTPAGVNEEAGE